MVRVTFFIFNLTKILTSAANLAFRALGRLLGSARDFMILTGIHGDLVNFSEKAQFDTQG